MLSHINLASKVIDREMELIFTPVKFGESGIVVCYPGCHQDFNIVRFLTYKKKLKRILGPQHNHFAFLMIHLNPSDNKKSFLEKLGIEAKKYVKSISVTDDLQSICQKILNSGLDPYLFLFNAQVVKSSIINSFLTQIHDTILSINRFGAQVFIERNIYKKDSVEMFRKFDKLLRNITYIPIYSQAETRWYLESLTKEWKVKISKKKVNEILRYCFGFLWVMREIVRLIKTTDNENLNELLKSPSIKLRIESITNLLDSKERLALSDFLQQKPKPENEETNSYLLKLGIISQDKNRYYLPLKPMESLLIKSKIANDLYLDEKKNIHFEDKNITANFSTSELRILRVLISKKGSLVNRDEIAHSIWKVHWENKYSDWAIDKLFSRIRSELIKIGLPKDIIKTKKGQGFILS